MSSLRAIFALFVSLTLALVPVASVAMAKSCAMTSHTEMTGDEPADCPCDMDMAQCRTMPQCRTASGCASQCFASCGVVPDVTGGMMPAHDGLKMGGATRLSSLSIEPPAPPPRA